MGKNGVEENLRVIEGGLSEDSDALSSARDNITKSLADITDLDAPLPSDVIIQIEKGNFDV